MKEQFSQLLTSSTVPLTIILDSLDQLRDSGAGLKDWIPATVSQGVTLVMSMIDDPLYQVGPELKVNVIPLKSMNKL